MQGLRLADVGPGLKGNLHLPALDGISATSRADAAPGPYSQNGGLRGHEAQALIPTRHLSAIDKICPRTFAAQSGNPIGEGAIPELALLHYKARTYNAALGRFLPPQAGFAIVFQDRDGAVDAQSENPALYPWVRVVCAVHGKVGTKLRKAMPGTSPGIGQTMILTTRLRAQV